jgi:hypothetical protein
MCVMWTVNIQLGPCWILLTADIPRPKINKQINKTDTTCISRRRAFQIFLNFISRWDSVIRINPERRNALEICNLFCSVKIMRKTKLRSMGCAVHSPASGRQEMHTVFQSENLNARDHLRDRDVDGRTLPEWLLKEQEAKMWTGLRSTWSPVAGSFEVYNKPLCFIKKLGNILTNWATVSFWRFPLHEVGHLVRVLDTGSKLVSCVSPRPRRRGPARSSVCLHDVVLT